MNNVRTILVKFVPATNKKPARILINDLRHKNSVFINDGKYEGRDIAEQAETYLKGRGLSISSQSEGKGYMMLHTNDFVTRIKGPQQTYSFKFIGWDKGSELKPREIKYQCLADNKSAAMAKLTDKYEFITNTLKELTGNE